jgi:hypothetical protein
MPAKDYSAYETRAVKSNKMLMVTYETNRYSVPYAYREKQLVLRAFAFRIEIHHLDQVIAVHPRCFLQEQDILDQKHYLPLLQQRPCAFVHAKPIRQWRQTWPEGYEKMLAALQKNKPEGAGVREFVTILNMHLDYPSEWVDKAVQSAVDFGAAHLDGVQLCLRQLTNSDTPTPSLDLSTHTRLANVGQQPINLGQYDQLVVKGCQA